MESTPRLHVVTDDRVLAAPGFTDRAVALVHAAGASLALHLRGPGTSARTLWSLARELAPETRAARALLVINDRVDLAAAVGADAVQLGQRSLPVDEVRRLETRGLLPAASTSGEPADRAAALRVGASVHSPDEARAARGADWLLVGTLYTTPSHRERAAAGPDLVARVTRDTDVPVLGIGGVSVERVAEVVARGAHGVAVLGGVWHSQHGPPARAALHYLEALGRARAPEEEEKEPS